MNETRFRCGRCGAIVRRIEGNPSMCPCCRRSALWMTVASPGKEEVMEPRGGDGTSATRKALALLPQQPQEAVGSSERLTPPSSTP